MGVLQAIVGHEGLGMWITVQRDSSDPYAIVTLQKEPVNAMDLEFWKQLADTIHKLEKDPKIKGIIICSGLKRDVFSAGNDIEELYAPYTSLERYKFFWKTLNTFLAQLLISPLVTVAAIRGDCPAGDVGRIGLNEVALGIPVPGYWGELFGKTIGYGRARNLLLSGAMISSAKALELNLIHERCSKDMLLSNAESFMRKTLTLPLEGRIGTKHRMFKQFSDEWTLALDEEAEWAFHFLSRPENVAFLKSVLQRLSKRHARM